MAKWCLSSADCSNIGSWEYNQRRRVAAIGGAAFFWLLLVVLLVDGLVSSDTQSSDYRLLVLPFICAAPITWYAWRMSRPTILTKTELIAPSTLGRDRRIPLTEIQDVRVKYLGKGERGITIVDAHSKHILLRPTENSSTIYRQQKAASPTTVIPIDEASRAIRAQARASQHRVES